MDAKPPGFQKIAGCFTKRALQHAAAARSRALLRTPARRRGGFPKLEREVTPRQGSRKRPSPVFSLFASGGVQGEREVSTAGRRKGMRGGPPRLWNGSSGWGLGLKLELLLAPPPHPTPQEHCSLPQPTPGASKVSQNLGRDPPPPQPKPPTL